MRKVATYSNFGDMIASNPCVLHFSGHGVKVHSEINSKKGLESGLEGDYLVIEDEN